MNQPPPYGQPPPSPYDRPDHWYPPPVVPYPAPLRPTNWCAIVSFVSGLLGGLGGVLPGVVFGIIGLNRARRGQGGRWLAIAGLVLSALWVLPLVAIVAYGLTVGRGTVSATDLHVGDCLAEIPDSADVVTVKTVDCEKPHAGEVFAELTVPDGDFPGQAAMEYPDKCKPQLATYSPAAVKDASIELYVLYPTEESWGAGDRALTCIATLDPPRTGSIKG